MAGFILLVTFGTLALFGNFNIFYEIQTHPIISVICFFSYFVVGTLWSFGKWWFYVRRCVENFREERKKFYDAHKDLPDCTAISSAEIDNKWKQRLRSYSHLKKPSVRENKRRILTWMMYWPFSAIWTIINDPITRLFKSIFKNLKFIYQGIVDRAFADFKDDFEPPPPERDETVPGSVSSFEDNDEPFNTGTPM